MGRGCKRGGGVGWSSLSVCGVVTNEEEGGTRGCVMTEKNTEGAGRPGGEGKQEGGQR